MVDRDEADEHSPEHESIVDQAGAGIAAHRDTIREQQAVHRDSFNHERARHPAEDGRQNPATGEDEQSSGHVMGVSGMDACEGEEVLVQVPAGGGGLDQSVIRFAPNHGPQHEARNGFRAAGRENVR